jgi:hypothetical protein
VPTPSTAGTTTSAHVTAARIVGFPVSAPVTSPERPPSAVRRGRA